MRKVFIDISVEPGLFWDALLKANLYVPLADRNSKDVKTGWQIAEGGEEFPVLLGVDSKGKHVLWLFTSPAVMADYTERNLSYLEMPSPSLMANARNIEHDVVLIGPERLTLSLHMELVDSLADGRVPEPQDGDVRHIPKDARVQVGPVGEEARLLEERFNELFKTLPDVLEGVFVKISDESGERLLLGLKLTDESKEAFRKAASLVARAAEGVLERGETMDITLISGSLKDAFAKHGKPFFKR